MDSFVIILFMSLFTVQTLAESCTVNSLYNTTCPIGDLKVQRLDLDISLSVENCDTIYKKEDFAVRPTVKYCAAQSDKLYTLVMADPDAVNTKSDTYVLHWMVANIKGSAFITGDFSEALTVKEYHPPSPPVNSGVHRYQFTVYTQEKTLFGNVAHENRANFLLETWIENTGQSVCGPVAGVQFRVEAATNDSA